MAGERNIFKKRGYADNHNFVSNKFGEGEARKKNFKFVVDCSASMYRFQGMDQRLERMLQTLLLLMEALKVDGSSHDDNGNHLIEYSIVGHSGDGPKIPLVEFKKIKPNNEKEIFQILERVVAHTQFCNSGDYTLEATKLAVQDILKEGREDDDSAADLNMLGDDDVERTVIVVSDANFKRYGIDSRDLSAVMQEKKVAVHFILIASLRDEALNIQRQLPAERGHVAFDTADLPMIFRSILSSIMK